jgi:Chloroplast envelope transporter
MKPTANRAHRRLLREEFRSGRLEAASSKAAVLSDLCDRLKYDQDAATEVHKGIYTERLETFLEDGTVSGALSTPPVCREWGQTPACATMVSHSANPLQSWPLQRRRRRSCPTCASCCA